MKPSALTLLFILSLSFGLIPFYRQSSQSRLDFIYSEFYESVWTCPSTCLFGLSLLSLSYLDLSFSTWSSELVFWTWSFELVFWTWSFGLCLFGLGLFRLVFLDFAFLDLAFLELPFWTCLFEHGLLDLSFWTLPFWTCLFDLAVSLMRR